MVGLIMLGQLDMLGADPIGQTFQRPVQGCDFRRCGSSAPLRAGVGTFRCSAAGRRYAGSTILRYSSTPPGR